MIFHFPWLQRVILFVFHWFWEELYPKLLMILVSKHSFVASSWTACVPFPSHLRTLFLSSPKLFSGPNIHEHTYSYTHVHTHSHILVDTNIYLLTHIYSYTHINTHINILRLTQTQTHTYLLILTHTHINTLIHTQTHTYLLTLTYSTHTHSY